MNWNNLSDSITALGCAAGLERIFPILQEYIEPAVSFKLTQAQKEQTLRGKSHLGGEPDLPAGFAWPEHLGRPLDFLLQVNLAEIAGFDREKALPSLGMLLFFYDLAEQPWGYDPQDLEGFRVIYIEDLASLEPHPIPNQDALLPVCSLEFSGCLTVPSSWSRIFDQLEERAALSEDESDLYAEFVEQVNSLAYGDHGGQHRLLGHSANVQGDMQLEAQLVSHGINCGDSEGYRSEQARKLEAGADDWRLLLQLDSDDKADLLWGDSGMLYFWIRRQDLAARRFDQGWLGLQCC